MHQIQVDGMRTETPELTPKKQAGNEVPGEEFEVVFRKKSGHPVGHSKKSAKERLSRMKKEKKNKSAEISGKSKDSPLDLKVKGAANSVQTFVSVSEMSGKLKSKDLKGDDSKLKRGKSEGIKNLKKEVKNNPTGSKGKVFTGTVKPKGIAFGESSKAKQEAVDKKAAQEKKIPVLWEKSENGLEAGNSESGGIFNLSGLGTGIFRDAISKRGNLKSNAKDEISHSRKSIKKVRSSKLKKLNLEIVDLRHREEKQWGVQIKNSPGNLDLHSDGNDSSGDARIVEMDTTNMFRNAGINDDKSYLLKDLKDSINEKIVESSKIILKNEGKGEIRLILKPESLGKVRIRLHLEDNMLTGKIFVDNQEAMDVLKQNMQHLERSFAEKGFTMASLDVSVGGKENNSKGKSGKNVVSRSIINTIEDSIPKVEGSFYLKNLVDLVV